MRERYFLAVPPLAGQILVCFGGQFPLFVCHSITFCIFQYPTILGQVYIYYIIYHILYYMIYYIWYIIYDILYFVYDILYIILYSIYHGSLKEVQISWFKRWNLVRVCVISHGLAVDRKNTAEGHFKDLCTALDAGHWCELNNGLLGDFVHFVFEFQFQ